MINLWDHQKKAHQELIEAFIKKETPLLVMPTGSGKSVTIASFIDLHQAHFKFCLVVRTRGLVYQLAETLSKFNLDYSIHMAGEILHQKNIIICSKDTLQSRAFIPFQQRLDVVYIWDEADETPEYQKEIIARFRNNTRFFFMGMTATPYNGLDHFTKAIVPVTSRELNRESILVDYDYFIPKKLDFSDVEVINGAFKSVDTMRKLNNTSEIHGALTAWHKFGDNRQTLVFCINVEHSKNTVNHINFYFDKEIAVHCDADSTTEEREEAIRKFKNGEIRFISNVRLFTRGTDIPEIGCILDLAPTLSLNLHIQKIGRGSRKNPIYLNCILIDVANNLLVNGHFYQEREIDLTKPYKKTKKDLEDLMMRVCEKCFRPSETKDFGSNNQCPFCGHKLPAIKKKKLTKYAEDKMFMESASEEAIEQKQMINDFKKMLWKRRNIGKKYPKDIARVLAHEDMFRKYGIEKTLKVKKSIGLKDETVFKFNQKQYVPLGGLNI